MHRVELKELLDVQTISRKDKFLMHRVELKDYMPVAIDGRETGS